MVLSNELLEAARGHGDAPFARITAYLDAGGDVDDADADGDTMLYFHVAYESGDVHADDPFRILRLLIARGADVNKRSRYSGSTPLYQACNCENQAFGLGAIRCLIEAGANIDEKTCSGQFIETPLSTSLDWLRYDNVGWDEIGLSYVSLLLRYGADLEKCWGEDKSAEDCLRHIENPDAFPELEGVYHAQEPPPVVSEKEQFLACKKLIADERGRRLKAKRKEILRLRSLLVRGRAKKSSDAILEPSFRLPDGVLWNVLSFWPPRRPKTFWRGTYDGSRPGCVFTTRGGRTGYWLDGEAPVVSMHLQQRDDDDWTCLDDAWNCFVNERLPEMKISQLMKMLATLKPLAKDAYKAAMAAREGKNDAAARQVVRALFEHIPRDAILDAYAKAYAPPGPLTGALALDYRGPGYLPENRLRP
jgi:hypothetical protein